MYVHCGHNIESSTHIYVKVYIPYSSEYIFYFKVKELTTKTIFITEIHYIAGLIDLYLYPLAFIECQVRIADSMLFLAIICIL